MKQCDKKENAGTDTTKHRRRRKQKKNARKKKKNEASLLLSRSSCARLSFVRFFFPRKQDRIHETFTALPSNIFTRRTVRYIHCSHQRAGEQVVPFSTSGHLGNPAYLGLHSATRQPLYASSTTRSFPHFFQHVRATGDSLTLR